MYTSSHRSEGLARPGAGVLTNSETGDRGGLLGVCTPCYIHQGGIWGYVHPVIHTREAYREAYPPYTPREAIREVYTHHIHTQGGY